MKMMVCYDDSDLSAIVIKEAQKHAKVWNAKLDIVKVMMREKSIDHSKLLEMEEQLEEEVHKLFSKVDIPYDVQLYIDDMEPGEKIVELAERKSMDLIFLGPRKRSKVGKLLFGSNAQYIILHATCPVVTITRKDKNWN